MTTFHDAVVRIERMVEDVEEAIASHASECVVPVASAASALMMAGCLGTTDPNLDARCGTSAGGSGGDQPYEVPVATALADDDEADEAVAETETPWWRRGEPTERFERALDSHPQDVLPQLRPPAHAPAWFTR